MVLRKFVNSHVVREQWNLATQSKNSAASSEGESEGSGQTAGQRPLTQNRLPDKRVQSQSALKDDERVSHAAASFTADTRDASMHSLQHYKLMKLYNKRLNTAGSQQVTLRAEVTAAPLTRVESHASRHHRPRQDVSMFRRRVAAAA